MNLSDKLPVVVIGFSSSVFAKDFMRQGHPLIGISTRRHRAKGAL